MQKRIIGIGVALAAAVLAPFSASQAHPEQQVNVPAVNCVSRNHAQHHCAVPWSDARLVRQLNGSHCIRDENWGVDEDGIWVHGCSGRFVEATIDDGSDSNVVNDGAWQPAPSWNQRFTVGCESIDGRDRFCQVDLGGAGSASLQQQISNTPCIEGQNWGSNRAGIWVTQGCRAVFLIDRRWR